jgi:hypothetical protein
MGTPRTPMTSKDGLELAKWHISHLDTLRISLASRAAVILSANALVAAGTTVLGSRLDAGELLGGSGAAGAITIILIGSLIVTGVSVAKAVQAVLNMRPSHSVFRDEEGVGWFFDPSATARSKTTVAEFRNNFRSLSDDTALDHALIHLRKITVFHYQRYLGMRQAVWLLIFALVLFLAGAISSLALRFLASL